MKKLNVEFVLFTAAGAVIGAMAVQAYKAYLIAQQKKLPPIGVPKELLIIEKL